MEWRFVLISTGEIFIVRKLNLIIECVALLGALADPFLVPALIWREASKETKSCY